MKAKRTFNQHAILAEARAGRLVGEALRKAIKIADEMGNQTIADELKLFLVQSAGFAGDSAPPEIRERVAKGISALTSMGEPLSRTKQMLKKHGVIETINRIAKYPNATKNFDKLCELVSPGPSPNPLKPERVSVPLEMDLVRPQRLIPRPQNTPPSQIQQHPRRIVSLRHLLR